MFRFGNLLQPISIITLVTAKTNRVPPHIQNWQFLGNYSPSWHPCPSRFEHSREASTNQNVKNQLPSLVFRKNSTKHLRNNEFDRNLTNNYRNAINKYQNVRWIHIEIIQFRAVQTNAILGSQKVFQHRNEPSQMPSWDLKKSSNTEMSLLKFLSNGIPPHLQNQ